VSINFELRCKHLFVLSRVKCPHGCELNANGVPLSRAQVEAPHEAPITAPRNTLPPANPRIRPPTAAARATIEALERQIASIGGVDRRRFSS
jgi:hypothetical protein